MPRYPRSPFKKVGVNIEPKVTTDHLLLPQVNDAANPTLAFGDGDTGFYEVSDDNINVSIAGVPQYQFGARFRGALAGSFSLVNTASTATTPNIRPNVDDVDTGIGSATIDALSLIAGDVEGHRITEAAGAITHNLVGNVGINKAAPVYPLDIVQASDDIAMYIEHDATTASKWPIQINSETCGPKFEQASTLGGATNYFEPDYPGLEILRVSSSRGTNIKIGNTTSGFYLYGGSNDFSIYNPDGTTQILEILNSSNIVNMKVGLAGTPSTDTSVTAVGGITITNMIMRVYSDGGAVNITADPQIAAGIDGQMVTLFGASDVNTLTLDNGTGLALSAQMVLAKHDNITLIYDSGENIWVETSRTTVA